MQACREKLLYYFSRIYIIIRLLGFHLLFTRHDARNSRLPSGLVERSISECQWVTVDKLAALRILNVQTPVSRGANVRAQERVVTIVSVDS